MYDPNSDETVAVPVDVYNDLLYVAGLQQRLTPNAPSEYLHDAMRAPGAFFRLFQLQGECHLADYDGDERDIARTLVRNNEYLEAVLKGDFIAPDDECWVREALWDHFPEPLVREVLALRRDLQEDVATTGGEA